ncbi:MAG TPA: hypothetical protein PK760_08760, partial [Flavobacteriales bacterium]|nr:hypothetical protein [Flavobacteriales bacterium]
RIPFLKALLIAYVWSALVVFLPTSAHVDDPDVFGDRWRAMCLWLPWFLAIAIAFDIRDLAHDPPTFRTVPQVFGRKGAKFFALLFLLPMLTYLALLVLLTYRPIEPGWREPGVDLALALPCVGVIMTAVLIIRATPERPWWYYSILLDGMLIVLPLLYLLGGLA